MTALGHVRAVEPTHGLPALIEGVERLGSAVVAFSGGVDSTLLAKVTFDILGERALAATAVSPSLPASERQEARSLAALIGLRHVEVLTREGEDPAYAANTPRRCFHCKEHLFVELERLRASEGLEALAYGAITDDLGDLRPGMDAARAAGARAPLLEAGLGKDEVRELSVRLGLPTAGKPAMACLASRIPHGTAVTPERLAAVEAAESAVRALGFSQVRVRYRGEAALVEVGAAELARALALSDEIARGVRAAGFVRADVDSRGYRPGGRHAPALPPTVPILREGTQEP